MEHAEMTDAVERMFRKELGILRLRGEDTGKATAALEAFRGAMNPTPLCGFEIPYPPTKRGKSAFCRRFGLNAYYAGKHWGERKKDAEELHMLTLIAMRKAGIKRGVLDFPVEICFRWDDGLDVDNHAAIGKAVVDAMKGSLLQDDNRSYFRRVGHEFWNGGSILVEIFPFGEAAE